MSVLLFWTKEGANLHIVANDDTSLALEDVLCTTHVDIDSSCWKAQALVWVEVEELSRE